MLPNIASLKTELQAAFYQYVAIQSRRRCGFFGEVPMHIIHEGRQMKLVREDGSMETRELRSASAQVQIGLKETKTLTPESRLEKLDQLASDMAAQMTAHFFQMLDQTLLNSGQVVEGENLSAVEAFFAMLEKVEIGFNDDGSTNSTIIAGPEAAEKLKQVEAQIISDPDLKIRMESLMERKWEAWRVREASRELVG